MAKKREDVISRLKKEQELSQPPGPPIPPKYLSESCLYLKTDPPEKLKSTVPPTSPKQLIYDYSFTSLPDLFPKLANLNLPYIREVGIKASIQQLAEYFQCVDYKFNLIQFWFLDIITDCLWRAQDEFQFPDEHQKIILEWILYIFNLIRAPHLNLTRNKLFKLFKEAMVIAEDYIESGCSAIPLPEELFALNLEQGENKGESYTTLNSSGSSISTDSTISLDSSSVASSYVAVKLEENTQLFKLPTKPCTWGSDDECLSSSVETVSEEEKPQEEEVEIIEKENGAEEEATLSANEDIAEFFKKPDLKKIPPRFMPSHESVVDTISISVETETSEEIKEDIKGSMWVDVAPHPPKPDCPSQIIHRNDIDEQSNVTDETFIKEREEEVIRAWFDYYVWQQRLEDMDNPRKGWIPLIDYNDSVIGAESDEIIRNGVEKWEWLNYIRGKQEETKRIERNIFINTCVLLAIKQFTFDYFYESFPFSLLRMAFRCPHHLITQEVNEKWYVPKLIKSDLKKPKPKKPKKEKVKKPKKDKKAKPKKKDKKGGKKKDKKGKSSKGSKKGKAKKLTKEEKAELARLKKEQEAIEAAIRKAEENKRFMFPLGEAATDDFYKEIFPGWVKIEKKEKGKKGKKDKKGKKK